MMLNELFQVLGINKEIKDAVIKNICTDSRKIKKGDIYIALNGKKYNGNDYAIEALKKGALIAVVDEFIDYDGCIKVENTYLALYKIGNYLRKKYNIPLIAITGSNGKTTTKELISFILKDKYNVLYNKENQNNLIGVSQTLFNLNKSHEIIVMELGSNHMGEISELSKLCEPNVGIITNIGSSHLKYFKNKKNIYKEKKSIVDGIKEGKLIVNGDDKYLIKENAIKCGFNLNNDLIAYGVKEEKNRISFNIKLDKEYKIIFNNPGVHFINDILLVIMCCLDFVPINIIIKRIKNFRILDKRMSIKKCNTNLIINDCYNSSFESFVAGFNYLKKLNGSKVIIFADILELGKHSKYIHKKISKLIEKNITVYTVGNYSKYLNGIHFNTVTDLINYLKSNPIKNSNIYIKGSRRMGLDLVVDFLLKK